MNKYLSIITILVLALFSGCTSVEVRPASGKDKIASVLIQRNPKVAVADFLDVLVDGFQRHGINTKIVDENTEHKDEYIVTYVAFRNWDMAPYLTDATISIDINGRRVAHGRYHLKGGGGFSLMKWNSTKSKIDPVIDQMLAGLSPKSE